ncbi:MAG: hypothetical protein AB8C95_05140 [Phycisphaeraceae bacterium]
MTEGRITPDDEITLFPIQALVLSLVAPWLAIRKAWASKGVLPSLLYHGLGLLVFFIGLTLVDALLWYGDISDLSYIGPIELLFMAVWLIVIELCYLLAALTTSCWGAGQERFGQSYSRSLSRWFQLTPFHAVWTLGLFVATDVVNEMRYGSYGYDYGTLNYEMNELLFTLMTLSLFLVYVGLGGWFTLRALAVPRTNAAYSPKCRWPALCETCGYALVGMTLEQTCPECGRPVETSLNPPRDDVSRTTFASMRLALFNPATLGQTCMTQTRNASASKALAISALMLLLSGPIGLAYIVLSSEALNDDVYLSDISGIYDFINTFVIGGLGIGLTAVTIGVTIVLSVGSIIGVINRVFGKRNVLANASQAACLASGYVVFIALLMYGFTGVVVIGIDRLFNQFGYGLIALLPLVWIALCLLLTLPYCFIVSHIVRSSRYANV